jgi:histidinol phosphatase-like enzyme
MHSALFLDVPNVIKVNSKNNFPIHREDWSISADIKEIIKTYLALNYKIILVGNYPNIPIRKNNANPIEDLFTNIANNIEKEFKLKTNSVNFDYATDPESFDYLPLPGMLYSIASDYNILLTFSFIITSPVLGKFIQNYSNVKGIVSTSQK